MIIAVRRLSVILLLALVSSCAGPLTTAKTGISQCSAFLVQADGGIAVPLPAPGEQQINMLLLSGGGEYGAYGAGVLKGWSEAERDSPLLFGRGAIKRSSISIVTGISTGALQATSVTVGNAEPDLQKRIDGPDSELLADYDVDQAAIGKEKGLVSSLRSNGLIDISNGLKPKIRGVVDRYWDRLRALPADRRTYVGMVNLDNGHFYVADLVAVAKSNTANAKDCYVEFILASAAVPVQFAPRFIDGSPYVDGGVRFGTFLGESFGGRLASTRGTNPAPLKVNFRSIINGNLSANDPKDDSSQPLNCDKTTLPVRPGACPKLDNTILAILARSAGHILPDQIYRDSARRLALELDRADVLGSSGFIYIPNQRISDKRCAHATKHSFDRVFMKCLSDAGIEDGRVQKWFSVDELPREGG